MDFERGLKPTEALDIGQIALAPEINYFGVLDPANMVKLPDGKLRPAFGNVSEAETVSTLLNIKDLKPERKLRFYGFYDEKDEFHRLSEYKGLYVKFKGVNYKIPE